MKMQSCIWTLCSFQSVEAVVEVLIGVDSPRYVGFIASSSCFDKEILLFVGKCFQGKLYACGYNDGRKKIKYSFVNK
jgi:hypothetical protein